MNSKSYVKYFTDKKITPFNPPDINFKTKFFICQAEI